MLPQPIRRRYQRRIKEEKNEENFRILASIFRAKITPLQPGESTHIARETVFNYKTQNLRRAIDFHFGQGEYTVKYHIRNKVFVITKNEVLAAPVEIYQGTNIFLMADDGVTLHKYTALAPDSDGVVTFYNPIGLSSETFRHKSPLAKTTGKVVFYPGQRHRGLYGLKMLAYHPDLEDVWINQHLKPYYETQTRQDVEKFLKNTLDKKIFNDDSKRFEKIENWLPLVRKIYEALNEIDLYASYKTPKRRETELEKRRELEKYAREHGLKNVRIGEYYFVPPDDLLGPKSGSF